MCVLYTESYLWLDVQELLGISEGFGFTRRNEIFVGRVAMLGFAAELIGQFLTSIERTFALELFDPVWVLLFHGLLVYDVR